MIRVLYGTNSQGKSGEVLRGWSEVVARSLARLEALIDFGEDEHLEDEVCTDNVPSNCISNTHRYSLKYHTR